jgi:putative DNA primase/helicase
MSDSDDLTGLTEAWQAERFVSRYGGSWRFDHRRRQFFKFRDGRWQPDIIGEIWELLIALARVLQAEARRVADSEVRKRMVRFAKYLQSASGIRRVLAIVQNLPPVSTMGDLWDRDPWLLGTPNGVVDLRTGRLRPGRAEDFLTLSTAVPFHPSAKCPRWEQFIAEVFEDALQLAAYIQRVAGYLATGVTTEHVLFLLFGSGSNGKSTFTIVLSHVLGQYAGTIPFTALELPQRSAVPDDLAALVGKRLVSASESIEGARLNEARLKALSGGDAIPARPLYGRWFEFYPTFKLVLSCNHKPTTRDDTFGFWRRVHLVPFGRRFDAGSRDSDLVQKLKEEGPGILRWIVEGCLQWQAQGLAPPPEVVAATQKYEKESDPLAEFIVERCDREEGASCGATELYRAYVEWCASRGLGERERLDSTTFGGEFRTASAVNIRAGATFTSAFASRAPDVVSRVVLE